MIICFNKHKAVPSEILKTQMQFGYIYIQHTIYCILFIFISYTICEDETFDTASREERGTVMENPPIT